MGRIHGPENKIQKVRREDHDGPAPLGERLNVFEQGTFIITKRDWTLDDKREHEPSGKQRVCPEQ